MALLSLSATGGVNELGEDEWRGKRTRDWEWTGGVMCARWGERWGERTCEVGTNGQQTAPYVQRANHRR